MLVTSFLFHLETFENYANRTCQLLALKELGFRETDVNPVRYLRNCSTRGSIYTFFFAVSKNLKWHKPRDVKLLLKYNVRVYNFEYDLETNIVRSTGKELLNGRLKFFSQSYLVNFL